MRKSKKAQPKADVFVQEVVRIAVNTRVTGQRPWIDGEENLVCKSVPVINHEGRYAVVVMGASDWRSSHVALQRAGYRTKLINFDGSSEKVKRELIKFTNRIYIALYKAGQRIATKPRR